MCGWPLSSAGEIGTDKVHSCFCGATGVAYRFLVLASLSFHQGLPYLEQNVSRAKSGRRFFVGGRTEKPVGGSWERPKPLITLPGNYAKEWCQQAANLGDSQACQVLIACCCRWILSWMKCHEMARGSVCVDPSASCSRACWKGKYCVVSVN